MRSRLLLSVPLIVLFSQWALCSPPPEAPLGPKDSLRHDFAPYDLAELNYLGLNYCENLLDKRVNLTSYTHLGYDANNRDAWHLQFPDDVARLLEGLAWEDDYSPVVRLEFTRRLVKGLLRAHVPGTQDYYFFRSRCGGKTFLILGPKDSSGGRVTLSNWGDALEGCLKVGFRLSDGGSWVEPEDFTFKDFPEGAGDPAVARNSRYWHESPFLFRREFHRDALSVEFMGKYWLSDEDNPLEYTFRSRSGGTLQVVIGEPGKPMPLLGNSSAPTFIHLPDQKQLSLGNKSQPHVFDRPAFDYLVLRRATAWACPGYSTALLVMWEQRPERIEIPEGQAADELRLSFAARDGVALGRVWLYPFTWVNDRDMRYIHLAARNFLASGTLGQSGYPSQQLVNAIPAGLAAGAYLLARYKDPLATTAAIRAESAAKAVLAPLSEGKSFIRSFFPVRAAAWMVRLAKEQGDTALVETYTAHLDRWMKVMAGPTLGYDGTGWASGWDHFNCLKAASLAYSATGNAAYRDIYERALTVYTIDEKGIYRDGKPLPAPGGFDTYAGSLPLGAWGHAGKLEYVDKLINLNVPNGWHSPAVPLKDLWNDAGAGPWAQDDSNPEYVGFSLRGLNLPRAPKWVVPVGAFPTYDSTGTVTAKGKPILQNPYFLPGTGPVLQLPRDAAKLTSKMTVVDLLPGSGSETNHLKSSPGKLQNHARVCTGDQQLVYKFDLRGKKGGAVECQIKGDGYRIEVSPDGQRWLGSYTTWSDVSTTRSLDLSFLAGNAEELVQLATIVPPSDSTFLETASASHLEREHCRYLSPGASIVYRVNVRGMQQCHLDLLAGNGYTLQASPDGQNWKQLLASNDIDTTKTPDAAWLWSADATDSVSPEGTVCLRFTDTNSSAQYGSRSAFLRRIAVFGNLRAHNAWVRISNTAPGGTFSLNRMTFRSWE